jgi:hypothetical protein
MPGKKISLTPLAARKQLLLLESDLNRAEFIEAARQWKMAVQDTKQQLTHLGSIVSTAVKLAATVATARRLFSRPSPAGRKSWLSILSDGMTIATSLWSMLRSRGSKQDH